MVNNQQDEITGSSLLDELNNTVENNDSEAKMEKKSKEKLDDEENLKKPTDEQTNKMIVTHKERAIEVLALILPSFFLATIATILSTKFIRLNNCITRFAWEYIIITVPIILYVTVLNHRIYQINASLVVAAALALTWAYCTIKTVQRPNKKPVPIKPFITNARSIINIITGIAILAVDFNIFPDRYHKTERYGFSLMDVGVGLYVFANGIVAQEIRGRQDTLNKTFLNTLPLLVIGVGRFVLTTLVKYKVSVDEYGVHWNFFITLAVTKLGSGLLLCVIVPTFSKTLLIGGAILSTHQFGLRMGLEAFVFSDLPRENFILANREGIVSSMGYVGLYFLSMALGFLFHHTKEKSKLQWYLILSTVILGVGVLITHESFNISRCLANSTYCLWVFFIGILMVTLFHTVELVFDNFDMTFTPYTFDAINYNGLTYFLIANVTTGLINLTINTSHVENFVAIMIMLHYMFFTTFAVCLMYMHDIKFKL